MEKDKYIIEKCKRKQLNLIKDSPISKSNTTFCKITTHNYNFTLDIIKNDTAFSSRFSICNVKYEKSNRGAYIIEINTTKSKYFMKLKSKNLDVKHEIEIFKYMKNLKHDKIINFIDYIESDLFYYFIYEYIEGINLWDYLLKKSSLNPLPEDNLIEIFIQIVNALLFLHQNMIIHCDLKLENVMITKNGDVKIIDFDLSRICDSSDKLEFLSESTFGTDQYIAPESYNLGIYSPKSDIWELGIILYILITRTFPFKQYLSFENSSSNMYRRNQFKHIDLTFVKYEIEKNGYNEKLFMLVKGMLTFNDDQRIDIEGVLKYLKS